VNEFLAAGRQAPPKLAPCDLRAMIRDAVTLVEKQAKSQDIKIATALAEDLPELQADAAQMKTCFLNILTNAVQAMPDGGRIRITAERVRKRDDHESLEVRFADTGPGIPAEEREKVFAPYFSTKTTGFGLGLAITRKIVEDHDGRIYVSGGAAPGAEMVVELPLPSPVARPAMELSH
jgi:signal transduction histidine kinase